jgi:Predicted membrane protein/domain
MKCPNHPDKEVLSFCHSCGEYLCRECLTDGKNYYFCIKEECQRAKMSEECLDTAQSYAGFWRRVAAYLIDYFLLIIPSIVILIFARILFSGGSDNDLGFSEKLAVIIFFWLYFSIMESSKLQGTIGKLTLKIKVTDINGERIGFGKATGRHFSKILSTILLGIGFFMAGFTERKQGLHDIIASCLVVRRNSTIKAVDNQINTSPSK